MTPALQTDMAAPKSRLVRIPHLYGIYLFLLIYINVKYSGLSPYMVVAAILTIYEGLRVLLFKERVVLTWIDAAFFAYFAVVCASVLFVQADPTFARIAFVKTLAYYLIFFGLRQALLRDPDLEGSLVAIAKVSILITFLFYIVLSYHAGVKLSDFLSFSFYGFTNKIFQSLPEILGSDPYERSVDLRRSSVAEVIAMLYMLMYGHQTLRYQIMALALIFVLQSRRALFVIGLFWAIKVRNVNVIGYTVLVGLLAGLFWLFFLSNIELTAFTNRLFSTDLSRRGGQFGQALSLIYEKPFFGHGYATKIGDKYIHNVILSSWFTMGVFGLIASFIFVGAMLTELFSKNAYRLLILIPFISLMIAGTMEGLLTPIGWACVAIAQALRMRTESGQRV